jgi:DNA-directed RNA polymerase specialized sigma24 family protein
LVDISDQVFAQARKLRRSAVEALLAAVYPAVIRIARGVCGREDVAEGVVRFVMVRAARVLPGWRDATGAERWFLHHTILTARRTAGHEPAAGTDLLAANGDTGFVAFVRAVRHLPQQQREAVLLHFGEHLNSRYLGVAMDCSADAAQAHLDAGRAALRAVGGAEFDGLLAKLEAAYVRLTPMEAEIPIAARRWAGKALRPRQVRRIVALTIVTLVVASAGWIVWKFQVLR